VHSVADLDETAGLVKSALTETKDAPDTQAGDHPTGRPPRPDRITSWLMANQVHPVVGPEAEETHAAPQAPYTPSFLHRHAVGVTMGFLLILGGVFLLGVSEAVVVAIPLVALFLTLNAVICVVGIAQVAAHPVLMANWMQALTGHSAGFLDIAGPAAVAFPLLALGLSGFETGVSMMPLVAANGATKRQQILKDHDLTEQQDFIFVEITVADPSEFATRLDVDGLVMHEQHRVLTIESATVPNALAALL
jgi:hypothetical protein